jgi:iron complex outermembrane receptor protein
MKLPALVAALVCVVASSAGAQSMVDRRVTLHARDIALRDALDRIALAATVKLSYSGDNLPLDRRVSVDRDSAPVLDVLGELVRPYGVDAVAISSDLIVLAPRRGVATDSAARSIAVLERVVVTGSVIAASERPLPIALDVIQGRDIERRDEGNLSKVFSGSVPGIWMWEQTPSTMLARYASIRGASSFSLSFPKVYIDGIEVANPLLLTHISPELVDRVEVIRGPQGAALYGSDAISGVVNIVSRHEGAGVDGTSASIRSTIGTSAARYASGAVPVQEHSLTLRGGSNLRSAGLTIGGASSGQYVPQGYSRELRSVADARIIGAKSTVTANARFFGKDAGVPANPLLGNLDDDYLESDDDPQQLRMYSAGSTLTLAPSERWTYSLTAGVDGYRLSNVSNDQGPVPSVADTALRAARGSANRGTFRASAITHVGASDRLGATITFGAEQSWLWDRTARGTSSGSGSREASGVSANSGLLAQTTVAFRNAAFLTGGIRGERIGEAEAPTQYAWLPMLGGSLVRDYGLASMKLRAAYGKGIRASRSSMHLAAREPRRTIVNPGLGPEEQSGVETGADIRLGRILGIHVTRFDQTVSGLIQVVTVENPTGSNSGPSRSSWYQMQNVGEITNRGWEAQASLALGAMTLDGAASLVDSRVRRLASSYTGDLRPGDRMLAVPSRTISGTASWVKHDYHLSATISRASDWVNYDRLRIADALLGDSLDADDLTGPQLREFWSSYAGTTRLRASASRTVWRGLVLSVTGENLLNFQSGEPDTITIVPGRTITVGIRARF